MRYQAALLSFLIFLLTGCLPSSDPPPSTIEFPKGYCQSDSGCRINEICREFRCLPNIENGGSPSKVDGSKQPDCRVTIHFVDGSVLLEQYNETGIPLGRSREIFPASRTIIPIRQNGEQTCDTEGELALLQGASVSWTKLSSTYGASFEHCENKNEHSHNYGYLRDPNCIE